jgi:Fur family ferric uptake transcriptional regulator
MRDRHENEKLQFERLFREEGVDRIPERSAILEIFLQTERHVTGEELTDLLARNGTPFDESFVAETLDLLCRYGFAHKNRFDDGPVRFEHRHLGLHHDHMICTKCDRIVEFEDDELEALQARIAAKHGFHMLQHRMDIYGICQECLSSRVTRMPLDMARTGERLRIVDFTGGGNVRMRLSAMGLRMGDVIEVVTSLGRGQLVIAVDMKRYSMGRGLASKILVGPADSPAPGRGPLGGG